MVVQRNLFEPLSPKAPAATSEKSDPSRQFVDVALGLPGATPFQYSVPPHLVDSVAPGKRVFVSVRTRRMVGYVVGRSNEALFDGVRAIDSVIDETPIVSEALLKLTRWMAAYYGCSWGQCLETAMPAPFKKGRFRMKSRPLKTLEPDALDTAGELTLTPHQRAAYESIFEEIKLRRQAGFLLHGVTGSGKTEIYMHLIREVIKRGHGGIVLVPEISLTPQTVHRFRSRFGDCLAVIHSRLSQAKRVEEWHRIREGEASIVVGARSAIFSPVKHLGLIIIDEEHDTSYKQEETPRYDTRQVAFKRSELENAVVVLGGATPSLESYFQSERGTLRRLRLSERIEKRPLPEVKVIDMRLQPQMKAERIFSPALEKAVQETLAKKEQAMLFLNRRGFATYLHCASCGYVMTCENCRITLAYHYDKASLYCHICHYRSTPLRLCPGCKKSNLHYFGIGTQKVESEALRLFPGARIARMDADSTSKKDAHELLLRAFKKREIDVLIGTQMIAKGHDFPYVSLIGVISADTALHVPDFRAAERTFSLLTQVAGRAGRGDIPGKVLVQTYVPQHYSIQSARLHDYEAFYAKEIEHRKELYLPPFSRLVKLVMGGRTEKEVARQILGLAKLLQAKTVKGSFETLGPAPCLASKENGLFVWNLYIKGPSTEGTLETLQQALKSFKKEKVQISIDVDPQ